RFRQSASARDAVPTLVAIRGHFEDVRSRVLADHPGADANEATRLLINRLLHGPSQALKDAANEPGAGNPDAAPGELERLLRRLFGMAAAEAAKGGTKEPEE
ncbi:MAG: glutamyl-tRNA reductase, partial [Alphaproteobacteria bacterium]